MCHSATSCRNAVNSEGPRWPTPASDPGGKGVWAFGRGSFATAEAGIVSCRIAFTSHPIHPPLLFHLTLTLLFHPHHSQHTHTTLIPTAIPSTPLPSMSGEIRRKLVIVGECDPHTRHVATPPAAVGHSVIPSTCQMTIPADARYRRRCLRKDVSVRVARLCTPETNLTPHSLIVFSKGMFPEVRHRPTNDE